MVLLVIGARNLMKTKVGRAFVAIRDSDIAAEVIGINLPVYKTLSFAVSAFYAGIAGGLFGFLLGFFDPFTFNMILSIIFYGRRWRSGIDYRCRHGRDAYYLSAIFAVEKCGRNALSRDVSCRYFQLNPS
jgi:hypothetical protein